MRSGIKIAGLISNYEDDNVFAELMKLLIISNQVDVRKKIIMSFSVPFSAPALAFLGKRLRDENPEIVKLIFDQLT